MTLDEAIKRNRVVVDRLIEQAWPFDAQAVLLGTEAMKRLGELRQSRIHYPSWRLSGETEK